MGLLKSGCLHDYKTVSFFFLVIFARNFDVIFETIPSIHTYSNKPTCKTNRFFKHK